MFVAQNLSLSSKVTLLNLQTFPIFIILFGTEGVYILEDEKYDMLVLLKYSYLISKQNNGYLNI